MQFVVYQKGHPCSCPPVRVMISRTGRGICRSGMVGKNGDIPQLLWSSRLMRVLPVGVDSCCHLPPRYRSRSVWVQVSLECGALATQSPPLVRLAGPSCMLYCTWSFLSAGQYQILSSISWLTIKLMSQSSIDNQPDHQYYCLSYEQFIRL